FAIQSGRNGPPHFDLIHRWRFEVESEIQGGDTRPGLDLESPVMKKERDQERRYRVQRQVSSASQEPKSAGVVVPDDDEIRGTKGCLSAVPIRIGMKLEPSSCRPHQDVGTRPHWMVP